MTVSDNCHFDGAAAAGDILSEDNIYTSMFVVLKEIFTANLADRICNLHVVQRFAS